MKRVFCLHITSYRVLNLLPTVATLFQTGSPSNSTRDASIILGRRLVTMVLETELVS